MEETWQIHGSHYMRIMLTNVPASYPHNDGMMLEGKAGPSEDDTVNRCGLCPLFTHHQLQHGVCQQQVSKKLSSYLWPLLLTGGGAPSSVIVYSYYDNNLSSMCPIKTAHDIRCVSFHVVPPLTSHPVGMATTARHCHATLIASAWGGTTAITAAWRDRNMTFCHLLPGHRGALRGICTHTDLQVDRSTCSLIHSDSQCLLPRTKPSWKVAF